MQDIFAGILMAVVIVAGIWCIWLENFGKKKQDAKDRKDRERKQEK